jgi:S-ribosylhomocysteine lyase
MKKIASFTINHDKLQKGMYISRIDGDIVTYDIRMKRPNNEENDYLENATMHTIEHLFATFVRNTEFANNIVYVGPMGCRTGFYFIVRKEITNIQALQLVQNTFKFIENFEGEIPGAKKEECGNYREHNLEGAKETAKYMIQVLENWSEEKMVYEQ